MRRVISLSLALLAFATLSSAVLAQDDGVTDEQKRLIKQRDEKLEKAFLKNGTWTTDYDAALKTAGKSDRLIFGYFTRSYAP